MFNKKEYNKKYRQINKKYFQERRTEYTKINIEILDNLKINGCAICGYNEYLGALDFHHTNPEDKKFQITLDDVTRKDLNIELNKCILLCKNCHIKITNLERKNKREGLKWK